MLPLVHFPEAWYLASNLCTLLEQVAAIIAVSTSIAACFMFFVGIVFRFEGGVRQDLSITRFFLCISVLAAVFGGLFTVLIGFLFVLVPLYAIFNSVPSFIQK